LIPAHSRPPFFPSSISFHHEKLDGATIHLSTLDARKQLTLKSVDMDSYCRRLPLHCPG
jgi:hypothetical protein